MRFCSHRFLDRFLLSWIFCLQPKRRRFFSFICSSFLFRLSGLFGDLFRHFLLHIVSFASERSFQSIPAAFISILEETRTLCWSTFAHFLCFLNYFLASFNFVSSLFSLSETEKDLLAMFFRFLTFQTVLFLLLLLFRWSQNKKMWKGSISSIRQEKRNKQENKRKNEEDFEEFCKQAKKTTNPLSNLESTRTVAEEYEEKLKNEEDFEIFCKQAKETSQKPFAKDILVDSESDDQPMDFGNQRDFEDEEIKNLEELETDFPISSINRIIGYLSKENEHLIFKVKDQVTKNPQIFGAILDDVEFPNIPLDMAAPLLKISFLRTEIKKQEVFSVYLFISLFSPFLKQIDSIINKESGVQQFCFPKNYVPQGETFYYCINHDDPVMQNTKNCEVCLEKLKKENVNIVTSSKENLKRIRCKKGVKFNIGDCVANILNNLSPEDFKKFEENLKNAQNVSIDQFKKDSFSMKNTSHGLASIILMEKGLADGTDYFLTFNFTIDGVSVSNNGKKVYPAWLEINQLGEIRYEFKKNSVVLF